VGSMSRKNAPDQIDVAGRVAPVTEAIGKQKKSFPSCAARGAFFDMLGEIGALAHAGGAEVFVQTSFEINAVHSSPTGRLHGVLNDLPIRGAPVAARF